MYSMLKVGGLYDGVKLPVSYAWIETSLYGKTTGFSAVKGIAEDADSFLAVKNSDPKTAGIPEQMAFAGFTLGVTFEGQPLDSVVELPPSDQATVHKVEIVCRRCRTEWKPSSSSSRKTGPWSFESS
jgi:hypothetical protein